MIQPLSPEMSQLLLVPLLPSSHAEAELRLPTRQPFLLAVIAQETIKLPSSYHPPLTPLTRLHPIPFNLFPSMSRQYPNAAALFQVRAFSSLPLQHSSSSAV